MDFRASLNSSSSSSNFSQMLEILDHLKPAFVIVLEIINALFIAGCVRILDFRRSLTGLLEGLKDFSFDLISSQVCSTSSTQLIFFFLKTCGWRLINFLEMHNPKPSLVHGDLWRGNAAIDRRGNGVIFDPAVWWADREVDISMTTLFGGFSEDFYKGYEEIWKLPSSYKERIEIYNLYHLLNHANMFGGTYEQQSLNTLKKISYFVESL